jgi:serine/threonine protein kinase
MRRNDMGDDGTGRAPQPGSDIIGGYRLAERPGASAGARLVRARRPEDPAPVLLRLCEPTAPAQAARFRREFELLQSLHVPGVPEAVAFFSDSPYLGMVLADCPGEPLETLLQGRRFPLPLSLRLASQLAGLLAGLHAAGVIHQDVRPANLLLDLEAERFWLIHFGLATRHERGARAPVQASVLAGDLAYLSSEQTGRMNRVTDDRTDLYSLAVTLYRLFTGRLPFAASDPLEWVHCHIARVPPPLTQVDPAIPGPLFDIVMRLLAKGLQVAVRILAEPEAAPPDLPASLLNYVRRSREKVILGAPKSALYPILRQAELVGLLYLENDLVAGAFEKHLQGGEPRAGLERQRREGGPRS